MTQIPGDSENSTQPAQDNPVGGNPAGMSSNGYPQDNPETYGDKFVPQYPAGYPQPPAYPQPPICPQAPLPIQQTYPVEGYVNYQSPSYPGYQQAPAPIPTGFSPSFPKGNKHHLLWVSLVGLVVLALVGTGLFMGLKLWKAGDSSTVKAKTNSTAAPNSPKTNLAKPIPADYIKKIDFANSYLPNFSEYTPEKCNSTEDKNTDRPFLKMPDTPDRCWLKMNSGKSEDKFTESFDHGYRHIKAGEPLSNLGNNDSTATGWQEYKHPSGVPYYLADMNGDGYLDAMTIGGNISEGTYANLCILDPDDPNHPDCLALWVTLGGSQHIDFLGNNQVSRALSDGEAESVFTVSMRGGKPYLTEQVVNG